jgi:hypothetical protein
MRSGLAHAEGGKADTGRTPSLELLANCASGNFSPQSCRSTRRAQRGNLQYKLGVPGVAV